MSSEECANIWMFRPLLYYYFHFTQLIAVLCDDLWLFDR